MKRNVHITEVNGNSIVIINAMRFKGRHLERNLSRRRRGGKIEYKLAEG